MSSADESALSELDCIRPASFAIAIAVSSLSPVIITTWIPAPITSAIASLASGLTSSLIPTRPMITISSFIVFSTRAFCEYPNAKTLIALAASSSIFLSRTALSIVFTSPFSSKNFLAFARSLSGAPL